MLLEVRMQSRHPLLFGKLSTNSSLTPHPQLPGVRRLAPSIIIAFDQHRQCTPRSSPGRVGSGWGPGGVPVRSGGGVLGPVLQPSTFPNATVVSSPSLFSLWSFRHLKNPVAFVLVTLRDRMEGYACIRLDTVKQKSHWTNYKNKNFHF